MKEHRVRTLRVTTTNSLQRDAGDPCSLQLLRLELELELRPAAAATAPPAPPTPPPPPAPPPSLLAPNTPPRHLHHRHHHHRHHHYHHCHGHRRHHALDETSTNSVLEECFSYGNLPVIDLFTSRLVKVKPQKYDISLHSCTSHFFTDKFPIFTKICANGCDLDNLCENYKISLDHLFNSDIIDNWDKIVEAVKLLTKMKKERRISTELCSQPHLPLTATDREGNTPLLILGRKLLRDGAFEQAALLSKMLLEAGSDPNAVNIEGRSLLSYSIHYMDDSVELTRVLLNGGASVWPLGQEECGNTKTNDKMGFSILHSEQCSAFTWFLRGVIRRRKLDDHCYRTLSLISEAMGEQPNRMHSLVMRTMFRHAKCYKVLGPVFYQLKIAMMRYWTQPLELRFMCRGMIRSAIGAERMLSGATSQLGLPIPLERYICLE